MYMYACSCLFVSSLIVQFDHECLKKETNLSRKNTRDHSINHGVDNIQFSIFLTNFSSFLIYSFTSCIVSFLFVSRTRLYNQRNIECYNCSTIPYHFCVCLSLRLNVTSNKKDTQQRIHLRIKGEKHGCIEREG